MYLCIWDYYSDDLFSSSISQSKNTLCCIQNRMYNDCVECAFQKKEKDWGRSACLLFQPIKTNTKAPTIMLIPVRHFNQLSLKACDLISSQNQLWHFVSPLPLLSTSECSICFFSKSSRRFLWIKHVFSLCITPAYFCLWLILIDSLSIYGGNIQKRGNSIKAFLHLCTLVFLRQICCM